MFPHGKEGKMNRWGYDDVNGTVIGGNWLSGKVFYDGRPQSQTFTADTEQELIILAKNKMNTLKSENCPIGLYPDNSKWELRIYE